jgi:DNA-binding beta-propeller fold protein YncE
MPRLRRMRDLLCLAAALGLLACVSSQKPAPPPPPPMQVIGEWGVAGDGPGQMHVPVSLATDADGLVYVADAGSGFVNKYDWNGQALYSFHHPRLLRPSGIAVDRGGAIYVADYSAERLFIFFPDGRLLREMRGGPGRGFRGPAGVAVDSDGFIYVLEFDAARVQKFTAQGGFVAAWGREGSGPGEFSYPADIVIAPDGSVYVADTHGARVQKFTRAGEFLTAWSVAGGAPGEMAEATGLAVNQKHVFVADARNLRVQVWTTDGELRHSDTLGESFRGQYETPTDVALGRNGELLVLDPARPRVLRVKINF